jgi:UDP-glucose 4-epimerase
MVLELLDAGEEVLVLDNLSTGFQWVVPDGAPLIVGDVGDQALVRRLLKCNAIDAIIHFAGSIVVPDSVADPLGYYLNNACKSCALLACAVEAEVLHFIFFSTAAVYGMPHQNSVAEDARLEPI